jgi:hypothetical protein
VHRFVNDLYRPVGTYLYGRRMYELMVYWEAAERGIERQDEDRARLRSRDDPANESRSAS